MHGLSVTTIEGIGSTKSKLHPVQEAIAKTHGTQCGFCTPGIVMSMYALLRNSLQKPTFKDLEIAFQGNLCRCTGYRPILDGFKAFTEEWEILQSNNQITNGSCPMGNECCKLQNGISENTTNNIPSSKRNGYTPYDPSQEPIFPPELKLCNYLDEQYLTFYGDSVTWFRPTQFNELLKLRFKYPNAKIVVGNTEVGVETRFKKCNYPIRISPLSIAEMTAISMDRFGIRIGAAANLQNISIALKECINSELEHKTRIFAAIVDMLHWFAGQQIRNVASIGGNIMTGSPISDLNPIFIAAKVELELQSVNESRTVTMDENFFTSYRCNIVRSDEVLVAIRIPFTTEYQYFFAYKQARRRDDDTAIVNSAINITFKPKTNIVSEVKMAFGGMGPTTVVPKQTCLYLADQPWNESTLNKVYEFLTQDLPLPPDAPGGMTQYRKSLTVSFFFKVYLTILQKLAPYCFDVEVNEKDVTATHGFSSKYPKSAQYYEIVSQNQKLNYVGQPLPHLSSFKQASGEAVYCDDVPPYQNQLYMALVISKRAYAKFKLNTEEALKVDGVKLFLSAQDIPKQKNSFEGIDSEPYFAPGIVTAQGQILGAVIADNPLIAQKAANKVEVAYEDLNPIIISIEDAIKHDSYFNEPIIFEAGDIDDVFENAPHLIQGDCRNGAQEHFYLETQSVVVIPKNEDNEMEILCSTQDPAMISQKVAFLLGISENKIITKVRRVGGGFGGKKYPSLFVAVPAAIAAAKLGVPVRCMLERDVDMLVTGYRHPYYIKYKSAFTEDGKILGCEVHMYSNAGYAKTDSEFVLRQSLTKFGNAYNIPNIRLIGRLCKTNLPSNSAFRAFGAPQSILACEFMIRQIAEYLRKDVLEVMQINFYQEGDLTFYGQKLERLTLDRCWNECIESSQFERRKKEIGLYNKQNRWKKRGISIVPLKYGICRPGIKFSQGAALLHIYTDGSVLLSHGGVEMGQGLHTKLIQIAAQVLQIPTDKIYFSETSTDKVPNGVESAASITCDVYSGAVVNACKILNGRLHQYKLSNPNGCWEDWVLAAYMDRVSLSTTGFSTQEYKVFKLKDQTGPWYDYFSIGVGSTEVEIDCLTGDHQVLRTDIVMDVGDSLNPAIDVGQIEGAYMQGYGLYMIEELMFGPDGSLLTKGPGAYKLPGFGNIPPEFNVSLLKGAPNPHAIYSSKAIGEPPLCLATSIVFAVREAIKSARSDYGVSPTDFKLHAPITSAKIRMACEDHLTSKFKKELGSYTPWNVVP